MKISIIGTGYVGLVTGTILADFGHQVTCVDVVPEKIAQLKNYQIPFYEPGLAELVKKNQDQKRLSFTLNYEESIPNSEIIFICVGTPSKDNGEPNLDYLQDAIKSLAKYLKDYTLIVLKSTVPIGIEKELEKIILENTAAQFEFASCPEFLKEGSALSDTINPDRTVIGTSSKKAADILLKLYKPFPGEKIVCDLTSAQMIKYAANSFLATKISFANLIANICDQAEANSDVVLQGVGLDKRIGEQFLKPGVGYGGSCFPKDIKAFIQISHKFGINCKLLESVQDLNKNQIEIFIKKTKKLVGKLKGTKLAILGLAFKPNTDDVREAPALKIISKLLKEGAIISVYDPIATNAAKEIIKDKVFYAESAYQAVENSRGLLLVTEWNEFKEIDLIKVKEQMAQNPCIIDGRNIFDPEYTKSIGFKYEGIGRN